MVVSTRNTNIGPSNGTPLVLDDETKIFLVETITGLVEVSLVNVQRQMAEMANDIHGWVFRCEQFFLLEQTPDLEKVTLISIHLYDKAFLWHSQFVRTNGTNVTWEVYKKAILARFGNFYKDPMSELKNLKYETTAREYEDTFDNLLIRVEISEDHAVSLFMGGLPTKIEMGVRMFKLKTLADAYCLTNLQEATLNAVKKKGRSAFVQNQSRNTCPLSVTVADGNKLVTTSECKQFKWQFGPHSFFTDVMLLPLGGYAMVLGIQCTKALSKSVKQATLHSMALCSFPNSASTCMQIEEAPSVLISPILQQVITDYEDVFAIPTELPPKRDHDHIIPLIEGTQSVNIRPYRHPPGQKDAIEDKVEYLGHVISGKGVATDPEKVKAMTECPENSFVWTDESSTTFLNLKQAMEGHPIAFLSKNLSTKHQLMSTYEKEFLAIVYALEKWRGYQLDRHFKIKTDHFSLKYLLDQIMSTPTQLKWLPKLMGFDYAIQYKKGVENVTADALSILQSSGELFNMVSSTFTTDIYKRIVDTWKIDEKLQKVIAKLQQGQTVKGSYSWTNQELRRKGKLVVGNDQRKMRRHVKLLVLECDICQRYKPDLAAYLGLLQCLPMPTRIWSNISMDFIGSLPKSQAKEEAIKTCKFHLKRAHDRMKSQANKHRTDRQYAMGDWIEARVGQVAYKLKLPDSSQIHNVFHISQLKQCKGEVSQSGSLPVCDEQGVMKVEPIAILDRRLAKRRNVAAVFVLVQWANGSKEDATWEPIEQIQKNFPSFKL
ncbi:reverse transcriptase [Tanacetum coccineum]